VLTEAPSRCNLSQIARLCDKPIFKDPESDLASDEIVEILETHVPAMIRELNEYRNAEQDAIDSEAVSRELNELKKMVRELELRNTVQFFSVTVNGQTLKASFPQEVWGELPELREKLRDLMDAVR
jgi:hypothetical protein